MSQKKLSDFFQRRAQPRQNANSSGITNLFAFQCHCQILFVLAQEVQIEANKALSLKEVQECQKIRKKI